MKTNEETVFENMLKSEPLKDVTELESYARCSDGEEETIEKYDISHLKAVWDKHKKDKMNIQLRQSRIASTQSIVSILSMVFIFCGFFPGTENIRPFFFIMAIALALFFIIHRLIHTGDSYFQMNNIDDQFRKDYVCPNPDCQRFLGYIPFNELVMNVKSCYICKVHYKA